MKLEDESLLSALLDGELPLDDRLRVEAAMDADPDLRDRYRSLQRGRDVLVASAARPMLPVDLTSSVMALVASTPPAFDFRRVYRAVRWGAAAASVLVAGLLAYYSDLSVPHDGERPIGNLAQSVAPESSLFVADGGSSFIGLDSNSFSSKGFALAVVPAIEAVPALAAPSPDPEFDADRLRLLASLERRDLQRVVVPLADAKSDTLDAVDRIVRNTTRKDSDFVRLSLPRGSVVDPALPRSAELFVVTVDERERRDLIEALREAAPALNVEETVDPAVPAFLADSGRARVLPGRSAAGLVDPPEILPFAHEFHPDHPTPPFGPNRLKSPVVENPSRPSAEPATGAPPLGEVVPAPRKITLLLWVTRLGDD